MSNEGKRASRYPRRQGTAKGMMYAGQDGESVSLAKDDEAEVGGDSPSSSEDDLDEKEMRGGRRQRRGNWEETKTVPARRTSSRANKCQKSMAEPRGVSDLIFPRMESIPTRSSRRSRNNGTRPSSNEVNKENQSNQEQTQQKAVSGSMETDQNDAKSSNTDESEDKTAKSPAPQSASNTASPYTPGTDDSSVEEEEDEEMEEDEDDNPLKVQRIIGTKSLRCRDWKEICSSMNTCEVDDGSVWHQKEKKDDDLFEERFLVKWAGLSFLHCSWETTKDLHEQIENAKTYLNTFFRKSKDGFLFTPEERNDGEYFDPAFTQIDRILEINGPSGYVPGTPESEDKLQNDDLGIITDKASPEYEDGLGRQFLIKWCNQPYSDATLEWERDLILNNVEYKQHVKDFLRKIHKPTKQAIRSRTRETELTKRALYKTFVYDKGPKDGQNDSVLEYQKSLRELTYKNGGQLRDYQAEGVAWMISNYINQRSCILADEMGLGKTLQTAATCNIIATQIQQNATFLIVAPLSTIPHWLREFQSWTDLNAIVYHGSYEDRRTIRELEMAYESDRPTNTGGNYLRKCRKNKKSAPWMAQVVITSPEMLVTDDAFELAEIDWDVLVVDEAHRLKNHNSKLAVTMRDSRFNFGYRILCTGTPIQNDMKELWTLLHFVDQDSFPDLGEFLEKYGDMKSKELVDELHALLRPYILRRLKEDVEKSMPPKEETIIEVELTLSQKQYYRALYEKNVKFLHKGKSKALDGPSLSNLAMQLRKCCNHVCLLNGIEEELRKQHSSMTDSDFLVKGSGKLVLLDKLLPRLKEEGHRVLIFSQFKIMLDILEDYLEGRSMSFARIDGSITGLKRQLAIDRFQSKEESAPFIMMLSTRAGGVGINLTAADTVIIFDSDWNPQNDLQAQARCHRIGQQRAVKVYRLLSARTYEMQMFNLSSRKMGLDQAVLQGFENNTEGALSKAEIEKLLKHGAYAILTEEKDGKSESASTEFVQQDIDSILERRARTIVHDGGDDERKRSGGTFSKASFKVSKSPTKAEISDDIEIDDPDFWKKMLGDSVQQSETTYLDPKQRRRVNKNYSEAGDLDKFLSPEKVDPRDLDYSYESDESADEEDENFERPQWGGHKVINWTRDDADRLERFLYSFGYANVGWDMALKFVGLISKGEREVKRMAWSLVLTVFLEAAQSDASVLEKKALRNAEKQREISTSSRGDGGVLAAEASTTDVPYQSKAEMVEKAFQKLWSPNEVWSRSLINDAVLFAKDSSPRDSGVLAKELSLPEHEDGESDLVQEEFRKSVWPSLKNRGWKVSSEQEDADSSEGKQTTYSYRDETFDSIEKVARTARFVHPELSQALDNIIGLVDTKQRCFEACKAKAREDHLSLTSETVTAESLQDFLHRYAPLQLLVDRAKSRSLNLSRRILVSIPLMSNAFSFIQAAKQPEYRSEYKKRLTTLLGSKQKALPHSEWTANHDIVLMQAIYKHGFVELESNYNGIVNDENIVWGPPFDSLPSRSASEVAVSQSKLDELTSTAKRAVTFLEKNFGLDETTKYLNVDGLAAHFCLEKTVDKPKQDTSLVSGGNIWELKNLNLIRKYKNIYGVVEACELPSRKELTKRAKVLLGSLSSGETEKESGEQNQTQSDSKFGLTVLDQNESSNILLAEILRGILKTPIHNKEGKEFATKLCSFALDEVQKRFQDIRKFGRAQVKDEKQFQQKLNNFKSILEQIRLVRANLSLPTRLYKNVLRVILGEPPIQGKSSSELLFPDRQSLVPKDLPKIPNLNDKSFGHRAIANAISRRNQSKRSTSLYTSNPHFFLMTAVETVIVSAACNHGIPVWNEEWKDVVVATGKVKGSFMTWGAFGDRIEKELTKKVLPGRTKESWDPSCYEQIHEYKAEPETLAKKTILMLTKLLKKISLLSTGLSSDHGPSVKVSKWFTNQLQNWAESLQLVDQGNEPLALTAVDFLDDVANDERNEVRFISCFDKTDCRDVLGQIASFSKLRAVFLFNHGDSMLAMIQQAVLNLDGMRKSKIDWKHLVPPAWNTGLDDELLLKRLLHIGIQNLEGDEMVIAGAPLRRHKFVEYIINLRVNELVSEFHQFEAAGTDQNDVVCISGINTESPERRASGKTDSSASCSGESKRKVDYLYDTKPSVSTAIDKKTRFV